MVETFKDKRIGPRLKQQKQELLEWALQNGAWNKLPRRERVVLQFRFSGMHAPGQQSGPLTQVEVTRETGIAQPNVSFAENNAFRKIKEQKSHSEGKPIYE